MNLILQAGGGGHVHLKRNNDEYG